MKTILVCNQKGGVGKSLVADEIAFSFERSGIPAPHPRGGRRAGRRGGHAGSLAGGTGGLAEGGGRGGHPDQDHVEGHRAADAHAQGGVQERPRCPSPRRSFRREPLASPWPSSTDAARRRRRLSLWWAWYVRLRDSRRNNRRSEACCVWTNASR